MVIRNDIYIYILRSFLEDDQLLIIPNTLGIKSGWEREMGISNMS